MAQNKDLIEEINAMQEMNIKVELEELFSMGEHFLENYFEKKMLQYDEL